MKSLKVIVLAGFLALAFSSPAFADLKIAYMDLSKVFDSYDKTKEYDKVLEANSKAYEGERNKRVEKLKELQGKLAVLKDNEKEKVQQEFDQLRAELQQFDQAQQTDLKKQRDDKIREILLEVEKIVSDYAQKEGYDIILNDRVLIYGKPEMEISDQILKLMNESYNKK